MFMLNNLNVQELESYIKTIFDLESVKQDKNIAVMEFELRLDSLAKNIETGTLHHVG